MNKPLTSELLCSIEVSIFNRIFFDINFKFLFSLLTFLEISNLNGILKISKDDFTFCSSFFSS